MYVCTYVHVASQRFSFYRFIRFSLLQLTELFSNQTSATSDFDWVELLENTNKLAENLGTFFVQLQAPPIPDFFLFDGDVTRWFERLNSALIDGLSQENLMKRYFIKCAIIAVSV